MLQLLPKDILTNISLRLRTNELKTYNEFSRLCDDFYFKKELFLRDFGQPKHDNYFGHYFTIDETICSMNYDKIYNYALTIGLPKLIMRFNMDILIETDKIEDIREYIENGLNINENLIRRPNFSFLSYAIYQNKPEIAQLLINAGANVNNYSKSVYIPIHMAMEHTATKFLEMLINGDSSKNIIYTQNNFNGKIPLMKAIENNDAGKVKIILKYDQPLKSRKIIDNNGLNIDNYIATCTNQEIIDLLQKHYSILSILCSPNCYGSFLPKDIQNLISPYLQ